MKRIKVAFSGAHRTGKTTLINELSSSTDFKATPTNAGKVAYGLFDVPEGSHPNLVFKNALKRQKAVLEHITGFYLRGSGKRAFDRSPLDVLAYTMLLESEGVDSFYRDEQCDLQNLIVERLCVMDFTFIVQPGIKWVDAEKKASYDTQKKVAELIVDLADTFLPSNRYFIIPESVTDLAERVAVVKDVMKTKRYL